MDDEAFRPRPFQTRVTRKVLGGENIILQAPTGSGKLWAALQPFFLNLMRSSMSEPVLPRTCRYAVPLRTLTEQFYAEYKDALHNLNQEGVNEIVQGYESYGISPVAQQTGERRGDPYFQSALTFCTVDQLLAAYLGIPYGVSRKDTNIKVAGVAGSYLVLDEWHLFPLHSVNPATGHWELKGARATSLAMLKMLQQEGMVRYVLMTATLSTHLVNRLGDLLCATVENLRQGPQRDEDEEQAFNRELEEINVGRSRTWHKVPRVLLESARDILEQHEADRQQWGDATTLVICNTVERAQQMYLRLWERSRQLSGQGPDILLHSRFTAERRAAQGKWIEECLGTRAWKVGRPNAIVVATQVVEVGLNFSVRRLHTELAPANSLIQRAGRCARFDGQRGEVLVYRIPEQRKWSLPYPESLCRDTWDFIGAPAKVMGFREEQALIDAVHTAEDNAFLDRFEQEYSYTRRQIIAGWRDSDKLGASRDLIRDVEQVDVIVHDDPKSIEIEPWRYQSFSLHPGILRGRFSRLQQLRDMYGTAYALQRAVLVGQHEGSAMEQDSRAALRCDWQEMAESDATGTALTSALVLAVPSSLAHYSDALGFAFRDYERLPELRQFEGDGPRWCSEEAGRDTLKSSRPFSIQICSYQYHVAGLVKAYQLVLADELRWAAWRLEDRLGYPHGAIDKALRVLLAYHDLGKLTSSWQEWAIAWQESLAQMDPDNYALPLADVLLAKTDYDSIKHWKLNASFRPRRPNHAVEGMALGKAALLQAALHIAPQDEGQQYPLTKAMRMAVARHHSVDARNHSAARLHQAGATQIGMAIRLACGVEPWCQALQVPQLQSEIREGDASAAMTELDEHAAQVGFFLYFVLVRALRLADKRADLSDLGRYPRLGHLSA